MKKNFKRYCSNLAIIAITACFVNVAFADSLQLVNQSSEDMSVFYNICTSLSPKPQMSDCDKGQNTLLLAGKINTVTIPIPPTGYTTTIVINHAQNAASYGNYNFNLCSSSDGQPALFNVIDAKIFCVVAAANLY